MEYEGDNNLPPERSRAELLDRYARHVQYCPTCQESLRTIQRADGILTMTAAALGLAGVCLASVAGTGSLPAAVPPPPALYAAALAAVAGKQGIHKLRQLFGNPQTPGR